MAKVLLHICCGPCASACVERLRGEGHDVTLFFSNANIAPRKEYDKPDIPAVPDVPDLPDMSPDF